ncbi:unnamed protein product [Echinostoma caproni]|uniref:SPX domain-containing protein n=1 Tax=Echinostoma caproni TaxID=27848 RepID=A0A183B229_9TREM|nr:unnamed protein product [Echinostoma caproni]
MKVPRPGIFEDADVWTFLEEFENVTELAGIRSDRGKLTDLRAFLKSRGQRMLDAARRGTEEMEWAAAKDTLIADLDTLADCLKELRSFQTAQLGVGVDALSRAVALHALLDRALTTLNDATRSELLLERFVLMFNDGIRACFIEGKVEGPSFNHVTVCADASYILTRISCSPGVPLVKLPKR